MRTDTSDQHFKQQGFASTHWSMVLAAGNKQDETAQAALQELCEKYWYPLYSYVRRRQSDPNDAKDLLQEFFCYVLERNVVRSADPARGRFRTFLLSALQNFTINEWKKQHAQKRGGGRLLSLDYTSGESRFQHEPSHEQTPEKLYERRWVLALLDSVLAELQKELTTERKSRHFEALKTAIVGHAAAEDYEAAAKVLGISASAAKQEAYRLRKRYRQLFRLEVSKTVSDPSEVDDEITALLAMLRD